MEPVARPGSGEDPSSEAQNAAPLKRAYALLAEAMDLLDAYDGPPPAAAHLSLAQEILKAAIKDSAD